MNLVQVLFPLAGFEHSGECGPMNERRTGTIIRLGKEHECRIGQWNFYALRGAERKRHMGKRIGWHLQGIPV